MGKCGIWYGRVEICLVIIIVEDRMWDLNEAWFRLKEKVDVVKTYIDAYMEERQNKKNENEEYKDKDKDKGKEEKEGKDKEKEKGKGKEEKEQFDSEPEPVNLNDRVWFYIKIFAFVCIASLVANECIKYRAPFRFLIFAYTIFFLFVYDLMGIIPFASYYICKIFYNLYLEYMVYTPLSIPKPRLTWWGKIVSVFPYWFATLPLIPSDGGTSWPLIGYNLTTTKNRITGERSEDVLEKIMTKYKNKLKISCPYIETKAENEPFKTGLNIMNEMLDTLHEANTISEPVELVNIQKDNKQLRKSLSAFNAKLATEEIKNSDGESATKQIEREKIKRDEYLKKLARYKRENPNIKIDDIDLSSASIGTGFKKQEDAVPSRIMESIKSPVENTKPLTEIDPSKNLPPTIQTEPKSSNLPTTIK